MKMNLLRGTLLVFAIRAHKESLRPAVPAEPVEASKDRKIRIILRRIGDIANQRLHPRAVTDAPRRIKLSQNSRGLEKVPPVVVVVVVIAVAKISHSIAG